MKNERIIRPYYDENKELRIGVFENERSKTPISSTKKHINIEDLEDILRNIEINEDKKPINQRAEVQYRLQRKNNYVKMTSLALATLVAVSLAGYGIVSVAKSLKNAFSFKTANRDATKIESTINEETQENDSTANYKIAEVQDRLKTYTYKEKLGFILKNRENFKNDIASSTGIVLSDEEILIQLGFINGLTLEQIGVYSDNYWLDFAEDYETILQELTIPSVNYLSFDHKLKGTNPSTKESIYGKYIMDDKDRIIYSYYADRINNIVSASYEQDKETVLSDSLDFTRSIAETIVYPNNPVQKENVKKYINTRKELIVELNKIPSYEEIAQKMNLTVNQVRELEVASLGTTSASNQIQFALLDITQVAVQLLPEDTVVEYTNTLGEIDNSILNYNSKKGSNQDTNPENYEHSKYLMLDIEHFMEDTINLILTDLDRENSLSRYEGQSNENKTETYEEYMENSNCSTSTQGKTRKLTL